MHIEIIDLIRCPQPHPFTWLIAQTAQISVRDVVSGVLGCPECGRRYPLIDGVLDLRSQAEGAELALESDATYAEDDVMRLAAVLGLSEAGGIVVLAGSVAVAAPMLARMLDRGHVLAVNARIPLTSGDGVSIVLTDGEIPLREGSVRGIALDHAHASAERLDITARTLTESGRLVAPVDVAVPATLHEIARDHRDWVAERVPSPPVIPLQGPQR